MSRSPVIILGIIFISAFAALSFFLGAERDAAPLLDEENPLLRISGPARPNPPDTRLSLVEHEAEPRVAEKAAESGSSVCAAGSTPEKFNCFKDFYEKIIAQDGAPAAMADLRSRYGDPFVEAQCHQLAHIVGRAAAEQYGTVSEAFGVGDSFCWSGYYHGVMENFAARVGLANLPKKLDSMCEGIPGKAQYSFDYYNCVHGLGHGVMAVLYNELPASLEMCNNLSGAWERSSCWSGAFMENIIADEIFHLSKYLKDNDPLYPCNAVEDKYKNTCYLMQTSRMLELVGYNFKKVFELCASVEEQYRDTCYQSLGRDASGKSVSDIAQTKRTCLLGRDYREQSNCVIGAVKDFISYYHSDKEARELCASLPVELQDVCYGTAESYYQSFRS